MFSALVRPVVRAVAKPLAPAPRVLTTPGSSQMWGPLMSRPYASAAPAQATASAAAAPASAAPAAATPAAQSLLDRVRTGFWSEGMKTALAGWTAFSSTHLIMSHEPVRNKLIAAAGSENRFRIFYSAVSIAIAGTLMFRFWRTPPALRGPVMHNLAVNKKSFSYAAMATIKALGAFCVTDAYVTPVFNPLAVSFSDGGKEPTDPRAIHRKYQVWGLQRVTRHSLFMGCGIFALGSMLSGRRLAELVLWAGVPIFGAIGAWHQEQRLRKTKPARFFEETSFMPFGAILDGRQLLSKVAVEVPASAYAAAFVTMGIIYFY